MGGLVGPSLLWLQDVTAVMLLRARRAFLQAAILLCVLVLLLWVAIFLYGSFYYSYMPTASFSTPVHFYYSSDCDPPGSTVCSFPTANVSFLRNERDQVYVIHSPVPPPVTRPCGGGSFPRLRVHVTPAVCLLSRQAMLHYRSSLLQALSTLFFSPLLLSGMSEQKQLVEVELFSSYRENSYLPTTGAVIEVQSRKVQVYKAQLWIHAHFTGIRYLLFNFPLSSAVLGVASNFAFLSVLVLFSYLQFIWGGVWPPEQIRVRISMRDAGTRHQQRREEARRQINSEKSEEKKGHRHEPGKGASSEPTGKGELESDVPETIGSLHGPVNLQDEADDTAIDDPVLLEAPESLDSTMSEEEPDAGEEVVTQARCEQQEKPLDQHGACMSS
ncbi:seipin-like [Arapaima gigas]